MDTEPNGPSQTDPIAESQTAENHNGDYAHMNGTSNTDDSVTEAPKKSGNAKVIDYTQEFPELIPGPGAGQAPHLREPAAAWKAPSLKSSVVTQVFQLPVEERRGALGQQFGDKTPEQQACNEIMQKTGTKIELCEGRNHSLTIVVTGKRSQVEDARKLIVQSLKQQSSRDVRIPKDHHGAIIGREGKKLAQLEKDSDCRIQIPGRDALTDVIKVIGPREGIEKAVHELQKISDEQSKMAQEHILVPRIYYPWIRGANDKKLNELRNKTSARINIPPPTAQSEIIIVTGEKDGVHAAAKEIKRIHDEKSKTCTVLSVEIDKHQHRFIIGQQRSGLHEILEATDVSVEVPDEQTDSNTIVLRGPKERLGEALSQVYAKASSIISDYVESPTWLHRYIIGTRGARLKELLGEHSNKLQVNFDEENLIYIEGPPDEVRHAKARLQAEAVKLQTEMTFKVLKVNPQFHRHIIGQSGQNISNIKSETNVTVSFPDEKTNSDEIRVEGEKGKVEKACAMIMDIVNRLENEKSRDILIEQRLHRLMIGQRGEGSRELRDKFPGVYVAFPEPGRKSDLVNLRGPKDEVDKCYKHLQAHAKNLAELNFQMKVPVFKDFIRNIIGKGGKTINKIRDETETRIEIPTEDQTEITITGKKANVEKAAEQVNKIQSELASVVTLELDIPKQVHSTLLRNGGMLIHSIQEECGGVHIHFPGQNAKSDKVTIRGPKEDAEKAQKHLSQLAKDKELSSHHAEIKAKPEHHRFLIGRGGMTIRKVREQNPDVRIIFPRSDDKDQETITLVGKKADVEAVQKQLEALLKKLHEQVEIEMNVDPKWHGHFVGRRAQVLREIQDQSGGISVSFPKRGSNSATVTLRGPKECCEEGKQRIEETVADLESQITREVIISAQHHRSLLSNRGRNIQEIVTQCNVQIRFPERGGQLQENDSGYVDGAVSGEQLVNGGDTPHHSPQDVIEVVGRVENVDKAEERLKALIPVIEVLNVPSGHHGRLIGAQGAEVRRLMEDFDVNISVPPRDKNLDEIKVQGPRAQVDLAIAEIMKKVEALDEELKDRDLRAYECTMDVPATFVPNIIGVKGANVTKLRKEYDANIVVPRSEGNPEMVTIKFVGYEENAHKLRDVITKQLEEYQSMIRQEITLDYRVHPRIIGNRGRGIRKIMDDYNVEVKFPRASDPDPNAVMIMGHNEDQVYDCIDHLRNLEEEYLQDITESNMYRHPQYVNNQPMSAKPQEVLIKNAPWSLQNQEEFPTMGGATGPAPVTQAPSVPIWGPRR